MAVKRLSKDHIDKFFDYDIDIDSRTIYMGSVIADVDGNSSGVDSFMAERVVKAIHLFDYVAPEGDKPITVIMNNPGGDWYHGMGIFDAIQLCKNHVTIKVYGYAMSMGSIILQAGDQRVLTPNSRFMIHYGYMGMGSNHTKIFDKWARETQRIDRDMEDVYLDRFEEKDEAMTKKGFPNYMEETLAEILDQQNEGSIPPKPPVKVKLSTASPEKRREDLRKYLEMMLNFDTILNAEQTVAIGLADSILGQ